MTRRRIARLLALVFALAALTVGLMPVTSGAEGPQATGWWSRRLPLTGDVEGQSGARAVPFTPTQEVPTDPTLPVDTTVPGGGPVTTPPLPVPVPTVPEPPVTIPNDPGPGTPNPTVPDGGLWVANDPSGPVAISAIRYRGDIGAGELTLQFAPGSTTVGRMVACPALSTFAPGPEGAWGDRPAHDCDRLAMTGRLSADATSVAFTIPQGFLPFGERVLDIVILPDPSTGDVFSVYFQPPGDDSMDVSQGQELPPPVAELPEIDFGNLPEPLVPFDPVSSFGSDSPTFSSDGSGIVPDDDAGDAEFASPLPEPIAQILEPFVESRAGRIIAVLTLLLLGGALWYFGGAPVRPPRLLGALAVDTPAIVDQPSDTGRGIGRFRRDRVDRPHRL
ncbi:hypothetical protein [Actinospongicola halichondriae]|uniref:hypothetical protein n=1 Tax=Actinospongicola halichondriae TaxID=3236844 RepID=UPI003D4077A1